MVHATTIHFLVFFCFFLPCFSETSGIPLIHHSEHSINDSELSSKILGESDRIRNLSSIIRNSHPEFLDESDRILDYASFLQFLNDLFEWTIMYNERYFQRNELFESFPNLPRFLRFFNDFFESFPIFYGFLTNFLNLFRIFPDFFTIFSNLPWTFPESSPNLY